MQVERQTEANLHESIQRNGKEENGKIIRKAFYIISYLFFGIMLIFIAVMLFVNIKSKGQDNSPVLWNHQIYVIRSNSMSPVLRAGSIAIVRHIDSNGIRVNDIITYRRAGNSLAVTHRVAEVVRGEEVHFITKGDANKTNDPLAVSASEVIGRVTFKIPLIGYILAFSGTRQGALVLLIIPGLLILSFQSYQMYRHFHKRNNA